MSVKEFPHSLLFFALAVLICTSCDNGQSQLSDFRARMDANQRATDDESVLPPTQLFQ
jgi:hypothetical protein